MFFAKGNHWSDRRFVITNIGVRKTLRNHKQCFISLNQGHISQNCLKKNGYTTELFAIIKIRRKHLRTHMLTYQPLKKDFGLLQTAV